MHLKLTLIFSVIALQIMMYRVTYGGSIPEPNQPVSFKIPANNANGFAIVTLSLPVTGTRFFGPDGRAGCNNTKYEYSVITAGPNLPVNVQGMQFTQAQHENYWKWVYDGYQGGHAVDWSQNCVGYAYGVGDWCASGGIIGSGNTACWVQDGSNATIAESGGHSVKITMVDCKNSRGTIIKTSSEKFRESGYYTQEGDCSIGVLQNGGGSVDLGLGNGPRGGLSFTYLKKK